MSKNKWNLVVDVENCTNCNACVLACQDEFWGNDFPGYSAEMPKHGHRWIDIKQKVRGDGSMVDVAYLPVMCQHCDEAPCMAAAENGAVIKRDDGIIIIDPDKSIGQEQIVDACPYGAVWWNEELRIPQHWFFDAHLLDDGWSEPRAVQSCATEAIVSLNVTDEEMAKIVKDEGLEPLHPEYGTKPRVWYKNLYRYKSCFIAGSIEETVDGNTDCIEGVKLALLHNDKAIQETISDNYGDFKFDRLEENSGHYQIQLKHDRLGSKVIDVELVESVYLGALSF